MYCSTTKSTGSFWLVFSIFSNSLPLISRVDIWPAIFPMSVFPLKTPQNKCPRWRSFFQSQLSKSRSWHFPYSTPVNRDFRACLTFYYQSKLKIGVKVKLWTHLMTLNYVLVMSHYNCPMKSFMLTVFFSLFQHPLLSLSAKVFQPTSIFANLNPQN